MRTLDIVARASRNLRRAKMRTFLTSVAIAVGGFAITASLMAGEGARQYVSRVVSGNIDLQKVMKTLLLSLVENYMNMIQILVYIMVIILKLLLIKNCKDCALEKT